MANEGYPANAPLNAAQVLAMMLTAVEPQGAFLGGPLSGSGAAAFRGIGSADLTTALLTPPPIGGTTAAAGIFAGLTINDPTTQTKQATFNLTGATAATVLTIVSSQTASRSLTVPVLAANDTLATLGLNQTFTGVNHFGNGQTLFVDSGQLELGGSSWYVGTPSTIGNGDNASFGMWNGSSNPIGFQLVKEGGVPSAYAPCGFKVTGAASSFTGGGIEFNVGSNVQVTCYNRSNGTYMDAAWSANTWVFAANGGVTSLTIDVNANATFGKWMKSAGQQVAVAAKTAAYPATANDYLITASATGGGFAITLPAASANPGQVLIIIKIDSSANAVTLTGTVNGAVNPTLATQYAVKHIVSDGTNWYTV